MKALLMLASSLSLVAGVALAQDAGMSSGKNPTSVRAEGARFSIDRGTGQGRIEIDCAGGDSTRACVEAVLPVLGVFTQGGGGGTGVVYATTSIKCGSTVYEVSTGTKGGNCAVSGPEGGPRNSAGCNDGGNKSSASCQTGCGATSGAGSCTIKAAQ